MRAGSLKNRVNIQRRVEVQSASGAKTIAWDHVCQVWADVRKLRGREFLAAYKETAPVTTAIKMRWPGFDLTPEGYRLVDVSSKERYDILSVIPGRHQTDVELMCLTGSTDGR
jgi:SPP1 family predicted phage head-tail adaptor